MNVLFFIILFMGLTVAPSLAADVESRLNGLEEALKRQQKTIDEQQHLIERLRAELAAMKQVGAESAGRNTASAAPDPQQTNQAAQPGQPATVAQAPKMDQASAMGGASTASGLFGGSFMTNPYMSLVVNSFYYASSTDERKLRSRGVAGFSDEGFDQRKGFNIREGELFLFAPVDPYFNLYANIPFTDNGASLEEAYFVTSDLPEGLQVKGGKFKSNFSRFNAQHPHAWDFADPPLAYRAFFGREGISEKGAQVTYLPPLPLYTLVGIEAWQGENPVLFNQNATGGPHAFTAYAKSSMDFGSSSTILVGPYVINGQTRTDTVANATFFRGNSTVYGLESVYKWKPSKYRSLIVQGEYLLRNQSGTLSNTDASSGDRLVRSQDAFYLQSLYQIGRWRVGARYDRLDLFSTTYRLAGARQVFDKPWRLTGALEFNPSEFSRIRLQYNYDRSGGDGPAYGGPASRTNHEVYLQLILGIGAHSAHAF